MLLSSASIAQPITGIGEIKIGMTETNFLSLSDIQSRKIEDGGGLKYLADDSLLLVITSKTEENKYERIYDSDHKKYRLKMSTGVRHQFDESDLYDVTIESYKEKIYEINVDISPGQKEFVKILTNKYGEPVETFNSLKMITCQNGFGAKSEHVDGMRTRAWGSKSVITAEIFEYFNRCSTSIGIHYQILDKKIKTLVRQLEERAKREIDATDIKAKSGTTKL